MNIKILDSWLREHLKTRATPQQIAEKLSLTSVGIEHIEKFKKDFVYDIEVTTNRPELMSVLGIAQEAATVLPQAGINAQFIDADAKLPNVQIKESLVMHIKNDPRLAHRIMAVIMEVKLKDSPQFVKDRLESSDIRSLNNVIDVTNYVMRQTGHPTHVFDYDRISNHTLNIRASKKGEKIKTLDNKTYTLSGGDIVADNGKGEIVDLLGIMGTANSVVTNTTKRILFFIDSVEQHHIRKTSMELGIRTEAAVLNEKGLNPERVEKAFAVGIKLFKEIADAKIISEITDIYPQKPTTNTITVTEEKINAVVGIKIPLKTSIEILSALGFSVKQEDTKLVVTVPADKAGDDMLIPEDIIEEIARVYGYHNIPNTLPNITKTNFFHLENDEFYWEDRIRDAFKYWGFTEVYTYPMVSQALSIKPTESVTIQNPLTEDLVYMRRSLVPSLQEVVKENADHEVIKIFEIGNVYEKKDRDLPKQMLRLAGMIKMPKLTFAQVKGYVEQLFVELGIEDLVFKPLADEKYGASVCIKTKEIGTIEIQSDSIADFEIDVDILLQHVVLSRKYTPVSKYPPVMEDLAMIAPAHVLTGDLMETIKKQSSLITSVTLLDKYKDTRTFHIIYQSYERNLTNEDITPIREKILKSLREKHSASLKS